MQIPILRLSAAMWTLSRKGLSRWWCRMKSALSLRTNRSTGQSSIPSALTRVHHTTMTRQESMECPMPLIM